MLIPLLPGSSSPWLHSPKPLHTPLLYAVAQSLVLLSTYQQWESKGCDQSPAHSCWVCDRFWEVWLRLDWFCLGHSLVPVLGAVQPFITVVWYNDHCVINLNQAGKKLRPWNHKPPLWLKYCDMYLWLVWVIQSSLITEIHFFFDMHIFD